jgi:hypothetical protein
VPNDVENNVDVFSHTLARLLSFKFDEIGMLSFVLRTVILTQDCFQLGRLLSCNPEAFLQLSFVADDVFRIAFVALNCCDIVEIQRPLLPLLASSNCDRFHSDNARPQNQDPGDEGDKPWVTTVVALHAGRIFPPRTDCGA